MKQVLEGLSRFAHLVNIDFFSDLLQAIKALLVHQNDDAGGERSLTVASSLHCVVCVFSCLKNQVCMSEREGESERESEGDRLCVCTACERGEVLNSNIA